MQKTVRGVHGWVARIQFNISIFTLYQRGRRQLLTIEIVQLFWFVCKKDKFIEKQVDFIDGWVILGKFWWSKLSSWPTQSQFQAMESEESIFACTVLIVLLMASDYEAQEKLHLCCEWDHVCHLWWSLVNCHTMYLRGMPSCTDCCYQCTT